MVVELDDNDKCSYDEDEIVLEIWQIIDDVINMQKALESWMKNGFINIAKARYVMGQQSVSASQIPSGDIGFIASTVAVVNRTDGQAKAVALEFSSSSNERHPTLPMRWFSALPPSALREAQKQFSRSVEIACDIATLKARLVALLNTFPGYAGPIGDKL